LRWRSSCARRVAVALAQFNAASQSDPCNHAAAVYTAACHATNFNMEGRYTEADEVLLKAIDLPKAFVIGYKELVRFGLCCLLDLWKVRTSPRHRAVCGASSESALMTVLLLCEELERGDRDRQRGKMLSNMIRNKDKDNDKDNDKDKDKDKDPPSRPDCLEEEEESGEDSQKVLWARATALRVERADQLRVAFSAIHRACVEHNLFPGHTRFAPETHESLLASYISVSASITNFDLTKLESARGRAERALPLLSQQFGVELQVEAEAPFGLLCKPSKEEEEEEGGGGEDTGDAAAAQRTLTANATATANLQLLRSSVGFSLAVLGVSIAYSGTHPLIQAVTSGTVEEVKALIDSGMSVAVTDTKKTSLLHFAVESVNRPGCLQVVQLLLGAKADANALNADKELPIFNACSAQSVKLGIFQALAKHTTNWSQEPFTVQQTVLTRVASLNSNGAHTLLPAMLASGLDVSHTLSMGMTDFTLLMIMGRYQWCDLLLEAKADINQPNTMTGDAPISFAIKNIEALKWILDKPGLNVNHLNNFGEGVVSKVVGDRCSEEVLNMLIEVGVDLTVRNSRDQTPLFAGTGTNAALPLLKILVEAKVDPNVVDKQGHTALSQAVMQMKVGVSSQAIVDFLTSVTTVDAPNA